MKSNLLKFYADRKAANDNGFPMANEFAMVVFSIKISSADIETYFSRHKYQKNLYRNRLSDALVADTLRISQTKVNGDDEVLQV